MFGCEVEGCGEVFGDEADAEGGHLCCGGGEVGRGRRKEIWFMGTEKKGL